MNEKTGLSRGVDERMNVQATADRFQAALHEQRFDFVLKQLGRVDSVLEVGTGLGSFSPRLAAIAQRYTGIEFDAASAAASATRVGDRGRVIQGDARKLPFEPRSFSAIVCLEVLEHLGDWQAGVVGIHKCLREGGVAVISVPYRKSGGKSETNPYHLYEPGEEELVGKLRELFQEVSVRYQEFEETSAMKLARVLHLRKVVGLDAAYRALIEGQPEALAKLKINERSRGWKLHLLATARQPRGGG